MPTPDSLPNPSAPRWPRDGATCRRLWPSDAAMVRAHFLRLDPETRASRFMAAVGDRAAAAYAERAVIAAGLMFGAFADGRLRGLGELRPLGPAGRLGGLGLRAEAALAVERGFRRRGLGGMLLRRLAEAARNRGVGQLHLRCLPDNGAMRHLAGTLGADLRSPHGESEAALTLARPTPFSLWREGLDGLLDLGLAAAALPRESVPVPGLKRASARRGLDRASRTRP